MRSLPYPFWLVVVSLALAIVAGGRLSTGQAVVEPGIAAMIGVIWTGDGAPVLAHAVAGALACLALGLTLWNRRVVQTPSLRFWIAIAAFFGLLTVSVLVSRFKSASVQSLTEWASYGIVLTAVIATSGRRLGPEILLWTVSGACGFLAARGILEYATQPDPTWRIFGGWVNPNALAGMLLLGFFPALGLMLIRDRVPRLAAGGLAVLIGLALALTQSKGGFLAAGTGLVALALLVVLWGSWKRAAVLAMPLAVIALLVFGLSVRNRTAEGGSALSRVTEAAATSEQSAGFRLLLWKSAGRLMRTDPAGVGLGAFRFESARPGLVPPTVLAHQSFLQIGAEAGALALILFAAALVIWAIEVIRGARALPPDRNLLRAAVIAAVVASGAHSFIDSDLHYFGSGFAFFAMLGIGLQLASDGTGPELLPSGVRRGLGASTCAVMLLALLSFGGVDWLKAKLRHSLVSGDPEGAVALAQRLEGLARFDGEALSLAAATRTGDERVRLLEQAAALAPSPGNWRAVARAYMAAENTRGAERALQQALITDPNNLPTRRLLVENALAAKDDEAAWREATALVAIETMPYYKVRALPEVIPTETAYGHLVLARLVPGRTGNGLAQQAQHLESALSIYLDYARITRPRVENAAKAGMPFAGETLQDVDIRLDEGREAAREMIELARRRGDLALAERAQKAFDAFTDVEE
ncbi:MAG TPA: O-antigen ligase family protein [Fimbriimonadaceae bacterium]|nr:O-antigen ligase family protein [Fimbriimonadaceae bacterium]HRJ97734.1 O-antigen ligase family protein [Fimbriimonadaceae bacterium]